MVQAEQTGLNLYFTKSLETNCKLEDLTTSSSKGLSRPSFPLPKLGMTLAAAAQAALLAKPQQQQAKRLIQSSLGGCFADGHSHPACLQKLPP